jgi:hypothetical protein
MSAANPADIQSSEDWNAFLNQLYLEWKAKPASLGNTIQLGFLCWYLLVEGECLELYKLDEAKLVQFLGEVTVKGLEIFSDEPEFLWIYGYIMSLFSILVGRLSRVGSKR